MTNSMLALHPKTTILHILAGSDVPHPPPTSPAHHLQIAPLHTPSDVTGSGQHVGSGVAHLQIGESGLHYWKVMI